MVEVRLDSVGHGVANGLVELLLDFVVVILKRKLAPAEGFLDPREQSGPPLTVPLLSRVRSAMRWTTGCM